MWPIWGPMEPRELNFDFFIMFLKNRFMFSFARFSLDSVGNLLFDVFGIFFEKCLHFDLWLDLMSHTMLRKRCKSRGSPELGGP